MAATGTPGPNAPDGQWTDETDRSVVVLFATQLLADAPLDDYAADAGRMVERVEQLPGFVSMKRYTAHDGESITVAVFDSESALDAWRHDPEHVSIQRRGRDDYYDAYWVHVCRTIRKYRYARLRT